MMANTAMHQSRLLSLLVFLRASSRPSDGGGRRSRQNDARVALDYPIVPARVKHDTSIIAEKDIWGSL
jgi:hypothetical protein